jgi:hypothetical protein
MTKATDSDREVSIAPFGKSAILTKHSPGGASGLIWLRGSVRDGVPGPANLSIVARDVTAEIAHARRVSLQRMRQPADGGLIDIEQPRHRALRLTVICLSCASNADISARLDQRPLELSQATEHPQSVAEINGAANGLAAAPQTDIADSRHSRRLYQKRSPYIDCRLRTDSRRDSPRFLCSGGNTDQAAMPWPGYALERGLARPGS